MAGPGLGDMPTISAGSYASSSFALDGPEPFVPIGQLIANARRVNHDPFAVQHPQQGVPGMAAAPARRVIQVFIADPNENVPLDNCLLYEGKVKVTDCTDQELFFELDIRSLLEKHNEMRTKLVDKKVKDRTEYLEPAKVRDLKMTVVTVATL